MISLCFNYDDNNIKINKLIFLFLHYDNDKKISNY